MNSAAPAAVSRRAEAGTVGSRCEAAAAIAASRVAYPSTGPPSSRFCRPARNAITGAVRAQVPAMTRTVAS